MNVQKLRIEALRAAVEIGSRTMQPSHVDVLEFADLYFRFLVFGETPRRVRANPRKGATAHR